MTRVSVLSGLAALAFAALVPASSACGGAKKACSSSTCQGCCDAAGTCQPGHAPEACGSLGLLCSTCAGGQICQFGVCAPLSGLGGGSSSNGGGVGGGGGAGGGGGVGGGGFGGGG
ncbi:MAG: hypothetical protein AB1938_32200, partial [Myxococcota bacterium]